MTSSTSFNLQNTSTNSSGVSFQGLSSGIQTSQLVQVAIQQASLPMEQLQAEVTANNNESSALSALESQMQTVANDLTTLNTNGLKARTVSSSDANNAYVTATSSGGPIGNYTVQVQQVATAAELSPSTDANGNPTNLSAASATSSIFSGSSASFTLEDTNGTTKTINLDSAQNNIYGLAAAINAQRTPDPNDPTSKGLGIQATVVNTGSGSNPYELVLTSTSTGSGTAGSNISIADTTTGGAVNNLGIAAGTTSSDSSGDLTLSGGTQSNTTGQNAVFTLDGIKMTRSSNSVTDAVQGVTFNLIQGGQTGSTTLTVAQDANTATNQAQQLITDYNNMISSYNTDTAAKGALSGNFAVQSMINQISSALTGMPPGMNANATYNSAASLGITTNNDGTLTLDSTKFQNALAADPTAAAAVFGGSNVSTNPTVSVTATGPKTGTGVYQFNITSFTQGGAVAGTITGPDGTTYNLTGNNGVLKGAAGTPLEGLYLNVSDTGTGSLTLTQGVGQATQNAITNLTDPATGTITSLLSQLTNDNTSLNSQIADQQSMLNTMQTSLENQYAQMESTISQLQSASQSVSSLG